MVDRRTVRRSYDELADEYADARTTDDQSTELLNELLHSLPASATVLDAGCGGGRPVLARLSESTTAVGLDFSREQLRLAAENASDASLVQGDMTALPIGDSSVDAVVAFWSLIHVPMDEHQRTIDEFVRVLRPGGRLLVCEGNEEWTGRNPDWLDAGVPMEWAIAGAEATREQLRAAGFEIVDRWGAAENLGDDEGDGSEDADTPWTFFSARLTA